MTDYRKHPNYPKYRELKQAGHLACGTIKAAVSLRVEREGRQAMPAPTTPRERLEAAYKPLALGQACTALINARARSVHTRVRNWRSPKAITRPKFGASYWVEKHDTGRYSSRCQWTKYEYEPRIVSAIRITPRVLYVRWDDRRFRLRAPYGWQWGRDANGPKLYRTKRPDIDIHFTASDIWHSDQQYSGRHYVKDLVRRASANYRERVEQRKEKQRHLATIRRAEREGACVVFADSIRAGNCAAGSVNWCRNHSINPAGYLRPSELLKLANGDARRISLVVAQALKRHKEDMRRGFCIVSDKS